jgi:hypothetical protein
MLRDPGPDWQYLERQLVIMVMFLLFLLLLSSC